MLCCNGHQHLDNVYWFKCNPSVLPLALAGSLGWRNCRNSCLVEGGRDFVDVVQGEEGENEAAQKQRKSKVYVYIIVNWEISVNRAVWNRKRHCNLQLLTMWWHRHDAPAQRQTVTSTGRAELEDESVSNASEEHNLNDTPQDLYCTNLQT